jgi:hypothetical protein
MPKPNKLRVLARGTASVQDYEALGSGGPGSVNRFHGWKLAPIGPQFHVLDELGKPTGRIDNLCHRVKQLGRIVEVSDRAEYRRALRDHDLWPADEATANAVGVKFDPKFGLEHGAEALADLHVHMDDLELPPEARRVAHAIAVEHLPKSLQALPPALQLSEPPEPKAPTPTTAKA